MDAIVFKGFTEDYFESWFQMSLKLFPDYTREALKKDLMEVVDSERQETFFAMSAEKLVGFINVSIRRDYVEGAATSPVGYLEALYVEPDFRNREVAQGLVLMAEKWAVKKGCRQMGSDTWVENGPAKKFHLKLGFEEAETLVHFIKDIAPG